MIRHACFLLIAALPGLPGPAEPPAAAPADDRDTEVRITTAWSAEGVRPGEQIALGVVLDIAENWHVNTNRPQLDFLIATEVEVVDPPPGIVLGDLQYPPAHPVDVDYGFGPQTLDFYTGRAPIFFTVSVDEGVEPGEYTLTTRTRWQACDDRVCLAPQTTDREAVLRVLPPDAPDPAATDDELFEGYGAGAPRGPQTLALPFIGGDLEIPAILWVVLMAAAIGGFLLNLTPCVLPLIPIKIMGLSQAAAGSRARCLTLGAVMALGVVAFWLALGGAIATTTAFATEGGFGIWSVNELFQYPGFTLTVGIVIALMGIAMLGLFTFQLPQWVYRVNPSHDSVHGSFGFGIMAAVLATPCTAPFMGAAAAWAVGQSPAVTLATFVAIGAGMASPYLVLAAFPALVNRMPRAGAASELIKQVMGLLILAAAAYFLGSGIVGMTVDPPDPPGRAYWWAVAALVALAGLWLAWRTWRITPAPGKRLVFTAIGGFFLAAGVTLGARLTNQGPIDWVYYTPERLETAQRNGDVILLEFTAEWCLNCHALEQAVLYDRRVVERLSGPGVTPVKIDLTGHNEPGNRKLIEIGRRTIPLLIVYAPGGEEVFRSDNYTVGQVLDALDRAAAPHARAPN